MSYTHAEALAASRQQWRSDLGLPALPADDLMVVAEGIGVASSARTELAVRGLDPADLPVGLVLTDVGRAMTQRLAEVERGWEGPR